MSFEYSEGNTTHLIQSRPTFSSYNHWAIRDSWVVVQFAAWYLLVNEWISRLCNA